MLSLCGLVACASTACDDKNDPLPPVGPADGPKVTLTAGETTPSTVSFSITPSDAAACAYMMLAEDQPVPSAAVILSDGVEAESKQSTPVTLRGLVPETTYVVVAAVTDGKTSASSEPLRLTTKKVTTPDDAVVLDRVIEAIYYGENLLNASADYYIQLANVACVQDEYGYYQPAGKGTLLSLDLWGAPSPAGNRALPTGTYMLDADNMPLTLDPNFTVLRVSDGSEFAEYDFESGEVIVERDGSTYTISATLTDSNEGVHNFKYTGPLSIADREAPTYDPITHDVNTTFIGADALYYGDRNKTGFGSFEVYLYDVPKKNGFLTRAGYQLVLELTTPLIRKGEDIFIANGTYTVSSQTPALFKFTPGYALPDDPYPYGSVCEQNDEDGAPYYALLNGGTIEINRTGTTYTFTANLETVEGIEIKGTYTGEIPIEDRNGWRPGGGGYSTLHLDVTPDLKGIRTGKLIYLGNYLRLGLLLLHPANRCRRPTRIHRDRGDLRKHLHDGHRAGTLYRDARSFGGKHGSLGRHAGLHARIKYVGHLVSGTERRRGHRKRRSGQCGDDRHFKGRGQLHGCFRPRGRLHGTQPHQRFVDGNHGIRLQPLQPQTGHAFPPAVR